MASYHGPSTLSDLVSPHSKDSLYHQYTDGSLVARAPMLGFNPDFNASAILARQQQYQLQVIATTFSTISILAAMCALYWFCMMRRNFRRDLVLLLIVGDFWKSTWFLVFSITTLIRGHISTASDFCQATGYFLQLGLESCDCAILLMSLHMMLQIFPPKNSILGGDGLYRIRYYVLAGWVIVPNFMTSLAFTNTGPAFVSQGGFCSLPVRPIWFRLALSWIPRYLMWIFILFVAIRIYRHVGSEFQVFGQEHDQTSSVAIPDHSPGATGNAPTTMNSVVMQGGVSYQSDSAAVEKQFLAEDDIGPDDDRGMSPPPRNHQQHASHDPNRRQSVPIWSSPFNNEVDPADLPLPGPIPTTSKSTPSSRRGSRQVAAGNGIGAEDFGAMPVELARPRGSVSTMASRKSGGEQSSDQGSTPGLAPITEHKATAHAAHSPKGNVATRALQGRRRAIQRQLRLLFIYPVMYIFLWMFPFIAHCFNYSDYYAQHPFFALSVLNVFCQNIMGFCDVCIFCWREKPWRHIPGSDGTFFGSFMFWRYAWNPHWHADEQRRRSHMAFVTQSSKEQQRQHQQSTSETSQTTLLGSIKRWSMSLTGQKSVHHRTSNDSLADAPPTATATTPTTPPPTTATPTTPTRTRPPTQRRTTSRGGSDRRIMQAELAHERLARERADYKEQNRKMLQEKRSSAAATAAVFEQYHQNSQFHQNLNLQKGLPERKEWWDRVDRRISNGDGLESDECEDENVGEAQQQQNQQNQQQQGQGQGQQQGQQQGQREQQHHQQQQEQHPNQQNQNQNQNQQQ